MSCAPERSLSLDTSYLKAVEALSPLASLDLNKMTGFHANARSNVVPSSSCTQTKPIATPNKEPALLSLSADVNSVNKSTFSPEKALNTVVGDSSGASPIVVTVQSVQTPSPPPPMRLMLGGGIYSAKFTQQGGVVFSASKPRIPLVIAIPPECQPTGLSPASSPCLLASGAHAHIFAAHAAAAAAAAAAAIALAGSGASPDRCIPPLRLSTLDSPLGGGPRGNPGTEADAPRGGSGPVVLSPWAAPGSAAASSPPNKVWDTSAAAPALGKRPWWASVSDEPSPAERCAIAALTKAASLDAGGDGIPDEDPTMEAHGEIAYTRAGWATRVEWAHPARDRGATGAADGGADSGGFMLYKRARKARRPSRVISFATAGGGAAGDDDTSMTFRRQMSRPPVQNEAALGRYACGYDGCDLRRVLRSMYVTTCNRKIDVCVAHARSFGSPGTLAAHAGAHDLLAAAQMADKGKVGEHKAHRARKPVAVKTKTPAVPVTKVLICRHCKVGFPNKLKLNTHIKYAHDTDRPLKCDFPGCGATFKWGNSLKGHHRTHTGSKDFKCTWPGCGKEFGYKVDWKRHVTMHEVRANLERGVKEPRNLRSKPAKMNTEDEDSDGDGDYA